VNSKPRISCQDGKSLRRGENGRYDFQIITFQDLKNAPVIAELRTFHLGFLLGPTGNNGRCPYFLVQSNLSTIMHTPFSKIREVNVSERKR